MQSNTAILQLSLNVTQTVAADAASNTEPDIAALTTRIRSGDEEGFREFHRLYFHRLFRFLLTVMRGREDEAKEALQETLLRVARHVRRFETEEIFWSWLKAVARSAAYDRGRKNSRYLGLLQRFALRVEYSVEEAPRELNTMLEESLEQLEPADRRIIEGKYLQGSTVKELAAETGLTEKAIESRLLRLRRQIRAVILEKLRSA